MSSSDSIWPPVDAVRVVARDQQVLLDRLAAVDGALGLAAPACRGCGRSRAPTRPRGWSRPAPRRRSASPSARRSRCRPASRRRCTRSPSSARSFSTFSTPSCVSASLSRVCEAASTNRLSHCLSLISAWFRLASPWITLIRSYTTRRSQPMIRSRLRRPTSKSITAVLWPRERQARCEAGAGGGLADAALAGGHDHDFGHCRVLLVVVRLSRVRSARSRCDRLDHELLAVQADLRRLARDVGRQRRLRWCGRCRRSTPAALPCRS